MSFASPLALNLDLASSVLLLRSLHRYLKHAVLECRLRVLGIHALRQRHETAEAAVGSLRAIDAALILLVLIASLAFEQYPVVGHLDAHVVLRQARQVCAYDELALALEDFDLRRKKARPLPGPAR